MPEELLFETEEHRTLDEVAATLRTVADRLADGGGVTLEASGDSITVEPPSPVEFEVSVEREGPRDGPGELSLELELEWDENASGEADASAGLSVE